MATPKRKESVARLSLKIWQANMRKNLKFHFLISVFIPQNGASKGQKPRPYFFVSAKKGFGVSNKPESVLQPWQKIGGKWDFHNENWHLGLDFEALIMIRAIC